MQQIDNKKNTKTKKSKIWLQNFLLILIILFLITVISVGGILVFDIGGAKPALLNHLASWPILGNIIKPEMKWALRREGDVILDIGYGVEGAKTLNLVEEREKHPELRIYAVLNIGRPITSEKEEIIEYVKTLGPVHGMINNSHLGNQTDIDFVQEGARVIGAAGKELGIPVIATTIDYRLAEEIGSHDCEGNPVRVLYRFMDRSFW